jgi:hypothetical protein
MSVTDQKKVLFFLIPKQVSILMVGIGEFNRGTG